MSQPVRPFLPPDPSGELPFEPSIYLLNLLVAVGRVRDSHLEPLLRPLGLTVSRYRALTVVWRLGSCTMSELAIMSAVDRTTLTRTVDQLAADDLVTRSIDPADRRKVTLNISRSGRALLHKADAVVRACNDECLAEVPEPMQRIMVRGLELMLGRLGATAEQMRRVLRPRQVEEEARTGHGHAAVSLESSPRVHR